VPAIIWKSRVALQADLSLQNSWPQCLLAVGLLKNGGASPADAGAGSLAASRSEFVAGRARLACCNGHCGHSSKLHLGAAPLAARGFIN